MNVHDIRRTLAGKSSLAVIALAALGVARADNDTLPVANANPKLANTTQPDVLATQLNGTRVVLTPVAEGRLAVENPTPTAGGATVSFYGYLDDGPQVAPPNYVPAAGAPYEASKTEPDKNTYLVLAGQHGADPAYDYGTHFLFQGHEGGKAGVGGIKGTSLTRINLDADAAHRVTVLATTDTDGQFIPVVDGSTWDPFAGRLLFSVESGNPVGGVWQSTPDFPATVQNLAAVFGHSAYEGLQIDSAGNVWLVEDTGGAAGAVNKQAKQPNSFIYRFVPVSPADLTLGGKLQVLEVDSIATGQPILFHPGQADADILSQDVHDLHTYGNTFTTHWITIHDTAADGFTAFDANALAKSLGGTPFKRPENGMFQPGGGFKAFYFTETGDTNALTQAGSAFGGFGAVLRLRQNAPTDDTGTLDLFFLGDVAHTGFDNLAFLAATKLLVAEDAGDTLHTQRNALDSLWMFTTTTDYSQAGSSPLRVLAEGRDDAATFDSASLDAGVASFPNEGDNEITGVHVSDGNPTVGGLLGTFRPRALGGNWRLFFTRQHGDNVTFEVQKSTAPAGG